MIRAVVDTNVLASGAIGFLIRESVPGQLLHTWMDGHFELIVSDHLLSELERTLERCYFRSRLTSEQVARLHFLLRRRATNTLLTVQVQGVATHPEDDLILATALSAHADYLVTGDKKLQGLGTYQGVSIVSPRAFLGIVRGKLPE